jgi:O-antigen/teichoic acid export membrane protein
MELNGNMGKYTRLGKNTITVFIGNAGAKLIGLLMLPFYTRWLSVEDYGTTDIINVYVSLLLGLVTACIADAVFVFPKDQSVEKQKSYFSSGLFFAVCSLSVTALLFKTVKSIFAYQGISNSFTNNTWFIYGLLVTNFLQQYIQQFVRSIDKMKVYSTTGIVVTVSTAVCSFLVIPRWGVFGYVLALIFANFAGMAYSFLCSSAYRYFCINGVNKSVCLEMLKYSVPLIPNGMMWWLVSAFNRPLMEKHLGMHAIGIFAVANKFSSVILVMFSIFAVSWQVSVLEEFYKEKYEQFYNTMFHVLTSGMFVLSFVITIFSKIIVGLFVDSAFYGAWKYIGILTLGAMIQGIASFVSSNFSAVRETKYFFYASIWGAVSSVIFNSILIPRFGIMGAAASISLSLFVLTASRMFYAQKYAKIHNIIRYVAMLLITCMTIIVMLYVQRVLLKCFLFVSFFVLFLILNYHESKRYISIILKLVKLKLS